MVSWEILRVIQWLPPLPGDAIIIITIVDINIINIITDEISPNVNKWMTQDDVEYLSSRRRSNRWKSSRRSFWKTHHYLSKLSQLPFILIKNRNCCHRPLSCKHHHRHDQGSGIALNQNCGYYHHCHENISSPSVWSWITTTRAVALSSSLETPRV